MDVAGPTVASDRTLTIDGGPHGYPTSYRAVIDVVPKEPFKSKHLNGTVSHLTDVKTISLRCGRVRKPLNRFV